MTIHADRRLPTTTAMLAGMLLTLFAVLGVLAHQVRSGTALDHAVLDAMVTHRSPGLTAWALTITTVFSPVGTGVLAMATAALLWWRLGSPRPPLLVLATLAGAGVASTLTKLFVGAHRPPAAVQLISETDHSYPSGHVTGTVALLGALAVVVGHRTGPVARAALGTATVLAAVAVGCTRLYLGVHWASDVLGGLLLGAAAAVLAHLAFRRMREPDGASGPGGSSSTADVVPTSAT